MRNHAEQAAYELETSGHISFASVVAAREVVSQAIADATAELRADNQRLESSVRECIQGTKELGESRADAVKRAEWYALCWNAGRKGLLHWANRNQLMMDESELMIDLDANGLPVETEELRTAIESALKD